MPFRLPALAAFLLLLGACTTTRPAEPDAQLPRPRVEDVDHSTYETFDVGRYPDAAPARTTQPSDSLAHDVPAVLLDNLAPESGSGVVYAGPGYRVQVFQSTEKEEADRKVNEAVQWWRRQAASLDLGATPEVYTVYRAPYYRVRVGNFETRDAARSFQNAIGLAFGGAFIVQDRVTVRR